MPAQTISPLRLATKLVRHVDGVQVPEKTAVPVESMVAMLPLLSLILRMGGVLAWAAGANASNPNMQTSTTAAALEIKVLSFPPVSVACQVSVV